MFLERFRNVVQTILTQNPQIFFGLRPDHGFPPPLIRRSLLIRGGNLRGGTYGYRLIPLGVGFIEPGAHSPWEGDPLGSNKIRHDK